MIIMYTLLNHRKRPLNQFVCVLVHRQA